MTIKYTDLQVTVQASYHTVAGTTDQLLCTKILRMILEHNQANLERLEEAQQVALLESGARQPNEPEIPT